MASKLLYLGAAIAIALGAAALAIIKYSGFVKPTETTPRIVLVNIDSVLEDQYVWDVVKKLIEISQRPDVVGVVLVINSPGGTVSATETLYTTVKGLNKTKYSVVTGLAASGAYYVAVATEKIFATPSSWVGSIGVVAILWPDTYLYDLPDYIYTTGPMKYHGRDLLDFYNDVERIRLNFVKAVLEGREGRVKADPRVFETASIFTASEALEMGLVDEIGGVFDAVRDMAKKLGLDKYVVVKLEELYNLSRGAPRLSVDAKFLMNSTPFPIFYILPTAVQWNIQVEGSSDATQSATRTEKPYVVLDMSHVNMVPRGFIEILRAELARRGYILVTASTEPQLVSLLKNATALVIVNPTRPFSNDAVTAVVDSAARGVRVVYFYDMRASAVVVISGVSYIAPYSLYAIFDPLLMYFNMSGLRAVYNYTAGQPQYVENWQFVATRPSSDWHMLRNVSKLILFTPSAVSTNAPYQLKVKGFVFGYGMGNYTIAAQVGNFTFIGTVRSFTPYFITMGDNWKFFNNVIDWLVEERTITRPSRQYASGVVYTN